MPYRAMFSTVITATVALLALTMWLWYVAPLVAATGWGNGGVATRVSANGESPERQLRGFIEMVMLASFVLICLLLIVGFAATFREWVRYGTRKPDIGGKSKKTPFVDAWKIAGERLNVEPTEESDDE
jgi:uncharacterized membrane protein